MSVCLHVGTKGGKVVFFTGLLQKLEKKGEVAAIMAHEIAHALCRHHAERSSWQAIVNTAYLFVSVTTGIDIPLFVSFFLSNAKIVKPTNQSIHGSWLTLVY